MKLNDNTAVLLLHCPDKPGILAAVTEFINQHSGNILYLDQYVNREEKVFFMRVKWDLDTFQIPKEKIQDYFQTFLASRFDMHFRLYFSDTKPRMAIFVSKMPHCLYDLLSRYAAGEWHVDIPLIISNHPDMEPVRVFESGAILLHLARWARRRRTSRPGTAGWRRTRTPAPAAARCGRPARGSWSWG